LFELDFFSDGCGKDFLVVVFLFWVSGDACFATVAPLRGVVARVDDGCFFAGEGVFLLGDGVFLELLLGDGVFLVIAFVVLGLGDELAVFFLIGEGLWARSGCAE